ncbi:MAG: tandem-95 repeat protein, partial [Chloroflexi bacterium]|nr:tandem-95 repeat protein [Chloroflexota bacterium]
RDSGALWGSFELDVGQADVRLTKSVTPQIAAPGARVTYTLSFSNVGGLTVSGVLISDTIPVSVTSSSVVSSGVGGTVILPGTIILPGPTYMWTMQNLAPGEGGVITITGVLSSPLAAGAFANTASIAVGEVESDTLDNTSTATVTVTNVAPVADDDGFEVPQDSSGNPLDVLDGDSDANGNTLTVFAVGLPDHGGAAADNDTNILYTPALGFAGVEVFTYTVSDGNDGYASATVTVTITPANNAPLAVDDGYATDYETTLVVSATNGVLDNDTDPDGDPLTATLSSGPSNGTLALSLDGSFTYTPTASFTGLDGFSYVAWDGAPFASDALSDTATVVIGVGVIPSVTLTVAVDGTGSGTVEPGVGSHVYELNTVVTLTATADIGSEFVGWSDDVISTSNPVTITMTRSMTVTATFDQSGYGIYLPLVLRNQ